jgi:hypothetical protein
LDAMHDASNGFEHGFMAVDDVRGLIESALERLDDRRAPRAHRGVGA